MIPYILNVTVITTICFLFYKLLLQRETFYRLNRWMLTGCIAASFLLPLLPAPREWSLRDNWMTTAEPSVAVAVKNEPADVAVVVPAPVPVEAPKDSKRSGKTPT